MGVCWWFVPFVYDALNELSAVVTITIGTPVESRSAVSHRRDFVVLFRDLNVCVRVRQKRRKQASEDPSCSFQTNEDQLSQEKKAKATNPVSNENKVAKKASEEAKAQSNPRLKRAIPSEQVSEVTPTCLVQSSVVEALS